MPLPPFGTVLPGNQLSARQLNAQADAVARASNPVPGVAGPNSPGMVASDGLGMALVEPPPPWIAARIVVLRDDCPGDDAYSGSGASGGEAADDRCEPVNGFWYEWEQVFRQRGKWVTSDPDSGRRPDACVGPAFEARGNINVPVGEIVQLWRVNDEWVFWYGSRAEFAEDPGCPEGGKSGGDSGGDSGGGSGGASGSGDGSGGGPESGSGYGAIPIVIDVDCQSGSGSGSGKGGGKLNVTYKYPPKGFKLYDTPQE